MRLLSVRMLWMSVGAPLHGCPDVLAQHEGLLVFFTGLDARAAAIVMRVVRNIVDTGRTIACTIHQPAIDIFEVRKLRIAMLVAFHTPPMFSSHACGLLRLL